MYFERGVLSDGIKCKYLREALETFYVRQFYKKTKEDNISQLGDEFLYLFVQIQVV